VRAFTHPDPIAMRQHTDMKILFVCLGNICRSPTAEGVVRAIAARDYPGLAVEVDSAGTADYHVGEPPDRRTIATARRHGYDLAPLRARQVTSADFSDFDRLIAMDRANLADLERMRPAGSTASIALFVAGEVPDPYYGGTDDFERVVALCESGAHELLDSLSRK
jgi:protein-tyrosine phosphatase